MNKRKKPAIRRDYHKMTYQLRYRRICAGRDKIRRILERHIFAY